MSGSEGQSPHYWLMKTEAGEWSWEDQASNGGISKWDGVKNRQAQNYMKSMALSDLCFFYHSGASQRRIVGVVEVIRQWYTTGEKEGAVDVRAVGSMRHPVHLKDMKGEEGLEGFVLFKQPRLSVMPVPQRVWERVCEMGGGYEST